MATTFEPDPDTGDPGVPAPYRRIAAGIAAGAVPLAAGAGLGPRIMGALEDPACSLDSVSRLIQVDPLLAARVVAMANSGYYRRDGRAVADVRRAVARLGLVTLRTIVTSMLVRQLAGSPQDPRLQARLRQLWRHTIHVAALAHALARRVTHQDPEVAFFAGVLHEAAGFCLLAHRQDIPEGTAGAPPDWQGGGEACVGRALFERLEVPVEVRAAVESLWDGYLAIPPASLGDTLLLAEELAPVASPLYWNPDPQTLETAGSPQIEIVLDQATLTEVLADSRDEVESLAQALL